MPIKIPQEQLLEAIRRLSNIVYDLKVSIDSIKDVDSDDKHQRFPRLFRSKQVLTSKEKEHASILHSVRMHFLSLSDITNTDTLGAVMRFGFGECSELASGVIVKALDDSYLLKYGYFISMAVCSSDDFEKNHNFLFYVPRGLNLKVDDFSLNDGATLSFKKWMNDISPAFRHQIILVDAYRNIVELFDEESQRDLLTNAGHDGIEQVVDVRSSFNFPCDNNYLEAMSSKVRLTADKTSSSFFYYFLDDKFENLWQKLPESTILVSKLNVYFGHEVQFEAYARKGYYVDAIADIGYSNVRRAKELVAVLGFGVIINNKLIIQNINENKALSEKILALSSQPCSEQTQQSLMRVLAK